MRQVSIDNLEPGMILAEPATGPRGNVLLGEGVEISEKHVRALKTWGVSRVSVEGDEAADPEQEVELSPELLAAAEESVLPRFRFVDREQEMMKYLCDYVVRQHALDLGKKAGGG